RIRGDDTFPPGLYGAVSCDAARAAEGPHTTIADNNTGSNCFISSFPRARVQNPVYTWSKPARRSLRPTRHESSVGGRPSRAADLAQITRVHRDRPAVNRGGHRRERGDFHARRPSALASTSSPQPA